MDKIWKENMNGEDCINEQPNCRFFIFDSEDIYFALIRILLYSIPMKKRLGQTDNDKRML